MDDKQKRDNTGREPYVELPDQTAKNRDPRANENLNSPSSQPKSQNTEPTHSVGSEITDGEDA
jgi:hypothetical protein